MKQDFFDRGERWFHTNDLAVMNRGKLIIHGRTDRVINSGGIKLDLNAIETALRSFDCVEDAVLLGVKSKNGVSSSVRLSILVMSQRPIGLIACKK